MIYQTFSEWWSSLGEYSQQRVSYESASRGWIARDAEIADLKRQLRQALAQVEIVDRALGDPGNTSSKVALDAYVQEKVGRQEEERGGMALARTYLQAAWAHVFEGLNGDCACDHHKHLAAYVQEKVNRAVLAESEWIAQHFTGSELRQRLAANRAKVTPTPADPPKEKP